jgi:hypothetical protein
MHRWGYSKATNCDCGHLCQTIDHTIDDYMIHAFENGLLSLHEATPEATLLILQLAHANNNHTLILLEKCCHQ